MFKGTGTDIDSSSLETVRRQFEQWRSSRIRREPIPEHLWHAAANLCKTHPGTHVCRYLRLSYADLKKHIHAFEKPSVRFVEFDLNSLSGWRLECDRADGARLRLSVNGQPPAVSELLRQFLS